MNIIQSPSPNFDSRDGQAIDMLVLHYTGMKTGAEALARLQDASAKVSAHYMIEENGDIYQLVEESNRAWHAGVSYWRGNTNINQRSIGIEIVNPGQEFGYRPFPEAQMHAVTELCRDILSRHNIPARNVVAHSDIAPTRKEDPGELFDWEGLAKVGIGLWPMLESSAHADSIMLRSLLTQMAVNTPFRFPRFFVRLAHWRTSNKLKKIASAPLPSEAELKSQFSQFGYDTTDLQKTILAFQRHFYPKRLTGAWDRECALRLAALLTIR